MPRFPHKQRVFSPSPVLSRLIPSFSNTLSPYTYDVTIIVIDHHMDVIMDSCDQITVFNFGSKLAEGKPEEIQHNPAVIEAYLGGE